AIFQSMTPAVVPPVSVGAGAGRTDDLMAKPRISLPCERTVGHPLKRSIRSFDIFRSASERSQAHVRPAPARRRRAARDAESIARSHDGRHHIPLLGGGAR